MITLDQVVVPKPEGELALDVLLAEARLKPPPLYLDRVMEDREPHMLSHSAFYVT